MWSWNWSALTGCLNAYVPQLTSEAGVAGFVRGYLGHRFASTKAVAQMTENFVESIMQFGLDHKIDLVRFKKGQRKDHVMQARLRAFKKKHQQGVVFIGVAQEKARVPRTVRKAFGNGGRVPLVNFSSANVNFYYFYCLDEDFGPFLYQVLLLLSLYGQTLYQWPRVSEASARAPGHRL